MSAAIIFHKAYRAASMEVKYETITDLLVKRDESAFEQVFKQHFKGLHAYAYTILKDDDEAEEIVQQVFFKLWERAEHLSITGPIASYLYRAVHNESLNYIKHQKVKTQHQLHVAYSMKNESEKTTQKLTGRELEQKLRSAMNELPEQCRTIFQMSRFDELKYREIAEQLGISIKTVENQMGKALKILRIKLVEFLPLFIILFNY